MRIYLQRFKLQKSNDTNENLVRRPRHPYFGFQFFTA